MDTDPDQLTREWDMLYRSILGYCYRRIWSAVHAVWYRRWQKIISLDWLKTAILGAIEDVSYHYAHLPTEHRPSLDILGKQCIRAALKELSNSTLPHYRRIHYGSNSHEEQSCEPTAELQLDIETLRRALAQLSELDRSILEKHSSGMTFVEIAQMHSIKPATARQRWCRAIKTLRRILMVSPPPPPPPSPAHRALSNIGGDGTNARIGKNWHSAAVHRL